MDESQVGRLWNGNADAWTRLARAGHDVYRDGLNTPAFLQMLPAIRGLRGLDIGCGEGHNTRLLAGLGARMSAIDVAERFIHHARSYRSEDGEATPDVDYRVASATALPFGDGSFDFATACMSLMDLPDPGLALREAARVLRPGGFLQWSITHPCFDTPHRRNLRRHGRTYAIEVGGYFDPLRGDVSEWTFGEAPESMTRDLVPFKVPRFTRTMSEWLNLVQDAGLALERVEEPRPTDEAVAAAPSLQDAQVVAYFLHLRARKP